VPIGEDQASVVIIGGGIVGASVAYHLGLRGVSDVLLLERNQLTSGTTWHAAGLVGQLRSTQNLTRLAKYTTELLAALEEDTGQATGFQRRGSVSVASTPERLEELKRQVSLARVFGLEAEVLGPTGVRDLVPHCRVDDLIGGIHLPGDGVTNPVDTTRAFAQGARRRGVEIRENVIVNRLITDGDRVAGVHYSDAGGDGVVRSPKVVVAAGMWSRQLAEQVGVSVPLHAAEHFYVVTTAVDGISPSMPVLRDQDRCSYFKEEAGKLLVGWFEPVAKPWDGTAGDGTIGDFCFESLPPDYDHIAPLMEAAAHRMPVLDDIGIHLFFNGPESFTPDDRYLLGETPEVSGLYVACGFNSIGIQSAGGAGKALADWIVDGQPSVDLWDVDVRRMQPFQSSRRYLRDRTVEALGLLYAMHWPFRQPETARGARRSILHDRLAESGACFGEVAGWERANWYAPEGVEPAYEYTFSRPTWLQHSGAEHRAVRESVGLFDLSSFGKFLVQGADAAMVLNRLSTSNMDVPVGKVVYTQWLNERGTIEADLTVTKEADDRFLVVSAAATQVRDLAWLRRHIPSDGRCFVTDVTSSMCVLSLMGPCARDVLSSLTDQRLDNEHFPFGTSQIVDLGYARVRATRISYVGELGWELYVPVEYGPGVFDSLLEAGQPRELRLCGYHALDSLRMEKGYRHWGSDITPDDTPIEAGLGGLVAWVKPDGFIGRDALERQRASRPSRRLIQLKLRDPQTMLYGHETIWRDGALAGYVASGAYGHTVGAALAMGYVETSAQDSAADSLLTSSYQVEVGGELIGADVSLKPWYDPTGTRLKT
jgi:glycine cleavage system aminomethyltransferase T/glycine/D-amino acid oxidase-like deaminating enzyme